MPGPNSPIPETPITNERVTVTTKHIERDATTRSVMAQYDNSREVQNLLSGANLPAPIVIGRPGWVHVLVADVFDLISWLEERGGEIHVSPVHDDVRTWTLHTSTEPRPDGSVVLVRVSAPLPAGETVMPELALAVVSA